MASPGHHCIIGAGITGLAVAKAFKDAGITYDQFEAKDEIGGNWYDGVFDSIHLISCRDDIGYDDYPMPKHWPDFPSRTQMHTYIKAFADEFHLRDHIYLNTEVVRAEPIDADGMAGWRVELSTGEVREYAGLVACNGHHWDRHFPDWVGDYTGKLLHSKDYKRPTDLDGGTVLTVGVGNSGADIAVEAARDGRTSYLSMRRGIQLFPKVMAGIPAVSWDKIWLPVFLQKPIAKSMLKVTVGKMERYGLPEPEHDLFDRLPTVNTDLLMALRQGTVTPKPGVAEVHGRTVRFTDGTELDVDTLVCATGFDVRFHFLDESMFEWDGKMPKLVGTLMTPGKANLYIFGLCEPRGGAGLLASKGGRLVGEFVAAQAKLDRPIVDYFERIGQKAEARELWGIGELEREILLGKWFVRGVSRLFGRDRPARYPAPPLAPPVAAPSPSTRPEPAGAPEGQPVGV
jgi:hypothetical protein